MSKIYDFTLSYFLTKKYTLFAFKKFYSEFIIIGRENIPKNTPVIFAPNHINALMDALAVASVIPSKAPIIFLARADIFNNKTAAKVLNFCKIMPAFRMRDGIENLEKNNDIFDRCVEILDNNKMLCIMPEGNQGYQKKLRPLVKGIFRIAFAAQEKCNTEKNVKIIPVGIDLGDYVKSNKHIIISIGKPIEVSEYMELYSENPVTATNKLRTKLKDDLNDLTLNSATELYYDCFETVIKVANETTIEKYNLPAGTAFKFIAKQKTIQQLIELEKLDPEKMNVLSEYCNLYERHLKQLNIQDWTFEKKTFKNSNSVIEGFQLGLTFVFFLIGLILNFLPYFSPVFIRKKIIKSKDIGFFSTLHFGLGMITFPVFYTIQTLLFATITHAPWYVVFLFLVSQYIFGKMALKWNSAFKKLKAKLRFKKLKEQKDLKFEETQKLRNQILETLENKQGE